MSKSDKQASQTSRRDFMRNTTAAAASVGAATFGVPNIALAQSGGDTLKVGLIGCGGRGTGAARQALLADPNTELVAMGDAFSDRLEGSLANLKKAGSGVEDRVKVDPDHQFTGFDCYQGVVDACDVVVLAAPPAFRPKHLRAAVEAGCHVFCEKPVGVDPAGVRSVLDTCRTAAKKNLSVVSGLCYRYQFAKQDTIQRIHDGMIGDILTMQTTYNTGALWHHGRKPEWSDMEYQVRNWLYFDWLSGDHINEQHIHSLDKIAWAMGDVYPDKAVSSGGRVQRTDAKYGNIYDHFNTVYEWDHGAKAFSSCRQWESSHTDVSDHVWGTKGVAHIQEHRIETYDGEKWRHKGEGPDDMYQNEHNALFKAIRDDAPINNGDYMCGSTLMAIMGRLAAYSGKAVTRKELLESDLSIVPDTLEWGDAPQRPIAVPGQELV
jgi:predicted dehydrogenase